MLCYMEIFSVHTLAVRVSSYESTWEVWRALKQLLRFSRALKTYILRASLTWYTHVSRTTCVCMLCYMEIFSVHTLAVRVSSYESTWEVWRALKQLLRFSRALKTYILRASLTWYTHVKHVAILYCTSPGPPPSNSLMDICTAGIYFNQRIV